MTVDLRPILVPSAQAEVYMPTPFHSDAIEYAKTRFRTLLIAGKETTEEECLSRADGILLRVGKMPREKLLKAHRVRAISRNGTGVDSIDKETAMERGIVVMNCPGGNAQAVAELVLTLTLTILRRVPEIVRRIKEGEIVPSITALAPGLYGKTIGLIGMGDIAQETAKIFSQSFNCKILVYSPTSASTRWTTSHPTDPAIPHQRFSTLADMLPLVDVLSLHCPYLPSTRHLISEKELGLMKRTAVVINSARGGIVDEQALLVALKEGRLGGAGLDVFEEEPLRFEKNRELLKMDNVVGLPHLGGSTDEVTRVGCLKAVDHLADYLDGKGATNRVY